MTEEPIDITRTLRDFLRRVANAGSWTSSPPTTTHSPLPHEYVPQSLEVHFDGSVVFVMEGGEVTFELPLPEGYTPLLIQVFYDTVPVFVMQEGQVLYSRITNT